MIFIAFPAIFARSNAHIWQTIKFGMHRWPSVRLLTIFGDNRQMFGEPKCHVLLWSLCECLMKVAVGKSFYFPAFNTWNPACFAFTPTSGICSFLLTLEWLGRLFYGLLCLCKWKIRALVLLDGVWANNNGGLGFFYCLFRSKLAPFARNADKLP